MTEKNVPLVEKSMCKEENVKVNMEPMGNNKHFRAYNVILVSVKMV